LLKLPEKIQEKVAAGTISSRSAYEISKLPNPETQSALAERVAQGQLSAPQAAKAVRQRQGKPKPAARNTCQTFFGENGWKVIVTGPKKGKRIPCSLRSYHRPKWPLSIVWPHHILPLRLDGTGSKPFVCL
jgi:ParB-like chromosome segregation protein Spo0J